MKYRIKDYPHLRAEVEQMSVEELLRAVICPNLVYYQSPPNPTASVFMHPTTEDNAYAAARRINGEGQRPSLIVSDMEYGAAGAIEGAVRFPSMWAAGAAADRELSYQMGAIAAKEAVNAGYHWTFGPCVDIVGNKDNPIVVLRTAGDNADTVIEHGGAYMEGLQDNGLIATLKHFPGDGYCVDDQHLTTPENPLSKEAWDDSFGRVYSELIERGAMAVMPGHIALPAYDEIDPNTGLYPPATVSKNLLTGLLREKLGFEGIIVSDAVNMTGFCGYMHMYHACAAFLEAGGDCLLFMHETEDYVNGMKACLNEGRLTMEVLKDRAYRMLCFAQEYFDAHPVGEKVAFDREAAEKVAATMTDKAVKVARNRAATLPVALNKDTRIAHVVLPSPWVGECCESSAVTEKLRALVGKVEEFRDPGDGKILEIAKSGEYDLILCSVIESPGYGLNTAKLCGPVARNMMSGWMRYQTPVVFITYYTNQFAETYKACVDTMIYTHGYTDHTADAVVARLLGK